MTTTIITKAAKLAGTVIVDAAKIAFTYYVALHIIDDARKLKEKICEKNEEPIDLTESEEEIEASNTDCESI